MFRIALELECFDVLFFFHLVCVKIKHEIKSFMENIFDSLPMLSMSIDRINGMITAKKHRERLDVSVSSARNASTCFRESGGGSGPTQLCSRATISQRVTRFFNDFRKVSSNYGRRKAGNGISGLKRGRSPARGDAKFSSDRTTVST